MYNKINNHNGLNKSKKIIVRTSQETTEIKTWDQRFKKVNYTFKTIKRVVI